MIYMTTNTTTNTSSLNADLNYGYATSSSASSSYSFQIPSDAYNGYVTTSGTTIDLNGSSPYTTNTIYINGTSIDDYILNVCNKNKTEEKEETSMLNKNKFNFGPISDGSVGLSIKGLAVKNTAGEFVSYDTKANEIINVDDLMISASNNMLYAMPVAIKDVMIGDIIIHNKHYCCVIDADDNVIDVVDISDGSYKEILPTKSPFGFNFITCVRSLINMGTANEDSPFGDNFLPYLLMMNEKNDKNLLPLLLLQNKDSTKLDPMILMLLLSK